MSNMDLWNSVCKTDPAHTKPITGKAYKGTSVNGCYVAMKLTEAFGPAGRGWGVKVVDERYQPGAVEGEVIHIIRVWLWAHGDQSCGFECYGQTAFVANTRKGLKTDEDAPKKSLTDALTKGASWLGVCADIHLGRWDDNRYVEQRKREEAEKNGNDSNAHNGSSNGNGRKPTDPELEAVKAQITDALGKHWSKIGEDRQQQFHDELKSHGVSRVAELDSLAAAEAVRDKINDLTNVATNGAK